MKDYNPPPDNPNLGVRENDRIVLAYWLGLVSADPQWQGAADQAHYIAGMPDGHPDEWSDEQIRQWQRQLIDFLFLMYLAHDDQ